ncbi:peptidyl-prolyl cis-trans isomerase [Bacillus sp. RG28]|uniref:Peptidyl-prolyl cis-trans isomerase n=1 Tax=Gottfriedia endophytica TaxID=2820819 RepID=A0A940SIS9_9BACI|nr:peptidyl-prolyl cis-trans isomerase [Gottfriedia endophytica]MBP0724771.1 peptidyl-prolyl cis-trans isomerase [Gottfriedia endophytica]
MSDIFSISGNVQFELTIDPSVWIFDERKIELDEFFDLTYQNINEEELYLQRVSKHWDREITEGAKLTPPNEKLMASEKKKWLSQSYGMPLKYFLKNAKINEDATNIIIETTSSEIKLTVDEAMNGLLAFSIKGKPLRENGPVHFYYADIRNKNEPITDIRKIIVR